MSFLVCLSLVFLPFSMSFVPSFSICFSVFSCRFVASLIIIIKKKTAHDNLKKIYQKKIHRGPYNHKQKEKEEFQGTVLLSV